MAFGSAGDVYGQLGQQDWYNGLPAWLKAQIRQVQYNTGGDGGQMATKWVAGDPSEWGGGGQDDGGFLRDAQGNPVMQLGNWDGTGRYNDTWLTDPSKVRHDPVLGDVVDPQYVHSQNKGGKWGLAAVAALASAGLLSEAGAFGAAGESGGYGSMTGVAGDESAGLAGAGGGGGGGGLAAGSAGYDASGGGLLTGGGEGAGGAGGASGGLLQPMEPITVDPITNMPSVSQMSNYGAPWYQTALTNAMNNPVNTARTIGGLYSMAQGLGHSGQHPSAGQPQYAGGSVAGGPIPQLNIQQQPFIQNPYLLRQMNSVPFMSGNGLLG